MAKLGYIKLRNHGTKRARAYTRERMTGRTKVRKVKVNVYVTRGQMPTNYTSGDGYVAWACTSKHANSGDRAPDIYSLGARRKNRCGSDEFARTPTAAIKKALISLGKKKEMR